MSLWEKKGLPVVLLNVFWVRFVALPLVGVVGVAEVLVHLEREALLLMQSGVEELRPVKAGVVDD